MRFFAVLALCLVLAPSAFAQKVADKTPTLDEADLFAIEIVRQAALRANDACAGLEAMKSAQTYNQQVRERFAKKYPDYDVDMTKGALVAKKVAEKK